MDRHLQLVQPELVCSRSSARREWSFFVQDKVLLEAIAKMKEYTAPGLGDGRKHATCQCERVGEECVEKTTKPGRMWLAWRGC